MKMVFEGDSLKGYRIDSINDKVIKIDLPNVKERKVGKWNILACDLYMCSKCYAKFTHKFNFCPTCGAEMKGER